MDHGRPWTHRRRIMAGHEDEAGSGSRPAMRKRSATDCGRRQSAACHAARFESGTSFAVDAPNGEHDLQDVVRIQNYTYAIPLTPASLLYILQEELREWAKQTVDVALIKEDVDAITKVHNVVSRTRLCIHATL